mmetsp:Transcript_5326/g.11992  ORF Transcript_5326/g.11992 Transcript_5326/m.11992 type:complete len:356 (+) Transcript_5326:194-1261(+)|eukprot:CAMPEP_0113877658 /NCGR_PEP_ID=MMETSP0780_2-20120614/6225_1 /TAXON_ID=652834 /ORGANISM="Palpitomonas bilix" /LENGTH=355 /DNA_ID=CAMNT_0000863993 /DNA_START=121 /DNA_END=1188 /DNA_ORIENTATION=+ /assembly_acc=CAM_ASM_000599
MEGGKRVDPGSPCVPDGIRIQDRNSAVFNYVHQNRVAQQMISSSVGAVLSSLLVTPFDVVKTRLQSQTSSACRDAARCVHTVNTGRPCSVATCPSFGQPLRGYYSGTVNAFFRIAQEEGVSALWKGLPPTLVMSVPATVWYFSVYENLRDFIDQKCQKAGMTDMAGSAALVAGISARVATVAVIAPLELIRTRMQAVTSDGKPVLSGGIWGSLQKVARVEGMRTLWRGVGPTLLRDVPFSGLYWYMYEKIKWRMLSNSDGMSSTVFGTSFVAGATAGTIAATLTLPFDVVKTRMQVEMETNNIKPSSLRVFKEVVRTDGVKGLFAGVSPRVAKVAPACAIMISSYEIIKRYFEIL